VAGEGRFAGEPLFIMRNHHVADSGQSPAVNDEGPGKYHGYFENAYGEQWVFVYD
jgi:hypothetical protein